ncbi:MAG TPA: hypothetical protein VGY49_06185 [Burkholderiaceae bacterium]|jgi:hypothetical protein|nr:hypothetical protein [Burkholderiaceae bacterium]
MLFSPIADPARLMVADQMARLRSGAVGPDKFDFGALKFDGARWGAPALAQLAQTQEGLEAGIDWRRWPVCARSRPMAE